MDNIEKQGAWLLPLGSEASLQNQDGTIPPAQKPVAQAASCDDVLEPLQRLGLFSAPRDDYSRSARGNHRYDRHRSGGGGSAAGSKDLSVTSSSREEVDANPWSSRSYQRDTTTRPDGRVSGGGSSAGASSSEWQIAGASGRHSTKGAAAYKHNTPLTGASGGYRTKGATAYTHKTPLTDDSALVVRRINVHEDDIHGLIVVPEPSGPVLVSGSKDSTVKKFSVDGTFISDLIAKPKKASYTRWITALSGFSDNSLVAGFRDGWLSCLDSGGKAYYNGTAEIASQASAAKEQAKKGCYKQRNQSRITAVKCLDNYTALVGATNHILFYDFESYSVLGQYTLEQPEWVYGFERIAPNLAVYIHAGSLSLFNLDEMRPTSSLLTEKKAGKGEKRAHISSVSKFEGTDLCALSSFRGLTRVLDLATNKIVHEAHEHCHKNPEKERVWQALPVPGSQVAFASCADDATIKLWDIRVAKSTRTIAGHPGRVSSMCFFNENSFAAGSCPDDVHSDPDKAQLCFYDLRK